MLANKREVIRLSPALGAEVRGVDLTQPLQDSDRDFLLKAWSEHFVLVLRNDKSISADAQINFCRTFGEIGVRARPAEARLEPEHAPQNVMYVSNKREGGRSIGSLPDGEMEFHIDQSYLERPAIGGCLHALEIPKVGGDTLFGNLCLAWETLPLELQRAIDGRNALNIFNHSGYGTQSRTANDMKSASHRRAHPIVREHPTSGRRFLYVNRLMTASIEGLPESESDDLLFRLFDHQEKPEFIYTHKWHRYDLLLWDNRCCIHARTDFDKSETRHLRRFSIRAASPD